MEVLGDIPLPLFEASGWGALGIFVILMGLAVYRWFSNGTIITKGEHDRAVANYQKRIEELTSIYDARLTDKDQVIADKDETNRANQETMKAILDTLDDYGKNLNDLALSQSVTEQVIRALNGIMPGESRES